MFPLKDTIHSETLPLVNWLFIILCTLVFLNEFSMPSVELDHYLDAWGVVPAMMDFSPHQICTVFSSMFLHAGWDHLIGNMWLRFCCGNGPSFR
jgi:membrane associated rhomboid family serine protease